MITCNLNGEQTCLFLRMNKEFKEETVVIEKIQVSKIKL